MKTTEILSRGALNELHLSQLVDQLDPSIGEATSVMGAMVTEVIRRSLRGGVLSIGRELSNYVTEQVELQIGEARPLIEKAAAETATEVARGEVDAVRLAAQEQDQQLAARIDEASQQAEQKAQKLSEKIDDTARQADEATTSLARSVENDLATSQTQTLETARAELKQQLEEVRERARKATAQIKERLDKLDVTGVELADQQTGLKRELDGALAANRRLIQELAELKKTNHNLLERVEILERPRGIRAFVGWLFGWNKKKKKVKEEEIEELEETEPVSRARD